MAHKKVQYPGGGASIAQWICLRLPYAALGSSTKHTIYAFSIYSHTFGLWYICLCIVKRTKINKKEAVFGPFLKKISAIY